MDIFSINHFSPHLTFLQLSRCNFPLTNLPATLTHLILGSLFNQDLVNLPNSLTHLIFGEYHLLPDDHIGYTRFPVSRHVLLDFRRPLINLPPSLTHLIFGAVFDPNNLSSFFAVSHAFTCVNIPSINVSPALTHLLLGHDGHNSVEINIPGKTSLKYFGFSSLKTNNYSDIPSLTHLRIINHDSSIPVPVPLTVTHLLIGNFHTDFIIPPSVTHLTISNFSSGTEVPPYPNVTHLTVSFASHTESPYLHLRSVPLIFILVKYFPRLQIYHPPSHTYSSLLLSLLLPSLFSQH